MGQGAPMPPPVRNDHPRPTPRIVVHDAGAPADDTVAKPADEFVAVATGGAGTGATLTTRAVGLLNAYRDYGEHLAKLTDAVAGGLARDREPMLAAFKAAAGTVDPAKVEAVFDAAREVA